MRIPVNVLTKLYVEENKSPTIIGKELGCGETTVRKLLKNYGIPMRTLSEANRLIRLRSIPILDDFREIIDGLLLGDGNLHSPVGFQAVYHQDSSMSEFIEYVSRIFSSNNYLAQTYTYTRFDKRTSKIYTSFSLNSLYTIELQILYNAWYNGGRKVIPTDISITPSLMTVWYLSDGSKDSRCKNATIATESFTTQEVELLCSLVNNEIGINCYRQSNNRIRIPSRSFDKFINYLGECPVGCYSYKYV